MTSALMITLVALALGGLGGLGAWIAADAVLMRSGRTLATRVAPWISDVSPEAHEVAVLSLRRSAGRGTLEHRRSLLAHIGSRLPSRWHLVIDGGSRTKVLLAQAGRDVPLEQWRAQVMESGLIGAIISLALSIIIVSVTQGSPVAITGFVLCGAFGGIWFRRWSLARTARARVNLMLEELPALCELLAICLTAGEGFREALARVTAIGDGPLVSHFRQALSRVELGVPLVQALGDVSARLEVAPLSRTLDHIISSIERGTPLAAVLRTQATEARQEAGRRLQERASAREVVMLMPLVFLILPITIAFAVFPGLLVIQSGL
jgi:tight adherence protein C